MVKKINIWLAITFINTNETGTLINDFNQCVVLIMFGIIMF
jgi:hypothetical protein